MTMHFLAFCLSTPWAMRPDALEAYADLLTRRYTLDRETVAIEASSRGGRASSIDFEARMAGASAATPRGLAVIPVRGAIVQHAADLGPCEGGTSTQTISAQLRLANADDSVEKILMVYNTPGGSVFGVQELAAEIRNSAKPVVALANSQAASAGYWLASQAGKVYVTPSGEVGSIGVYGAHRDVSDKLATDGIKVTLISSGKYKTEGHPFGPLSDDAKAFLQSRADDSYAAFTRDVARGRNIGVDDVRAGMGEGRVLGAAAAKEQKMVDGIMTYDQVVQHIMKRPAAVGGARSAMSANRRRLEIIGHQ